MVLIGSFCSYSLAGQASKVKGSRVRIWLNKAIFNTSKTLILSHILTIA
jgi:hypothetical protein